MALIVVASVAASGCVSESATTPSPTPSVDGAAEAEPFVPPFELVAPQVLVSGARPYVAGQAVKFQATFPASARVDVSQVRDVLWDFEGEYGVGLQSDHTFISPGIHLVTVSVRDVYDRTAKTTLNVSVAQRFVFDGKVAVGDGGQDARPPDGQVPHDYVDHAIEATGPVAGVRSSLSFVPNGQTCAQPDVCVPSDANLMLRVFDPSGKMVANVATGDIPRLADVAAATPGTFTVRVSGDQGVDVSYRLTVLVYYPEA